MTERNGTAPAGGLSSNRPSSRPQPAAGPHPHGRRQALARGSAEPHHLGRAERLTGRPGGTGTFRVASRTVPGRVYFVAWIGDGGVCGCAGWTYRRRCWHLELVALAVELEAAA